MEMPSNDHREVQSAPPETVMSRRKGKRKAEDLDESGDAAAPGPSSAMPADPRALRKVKAERARVRRSGEKRSVDALREAVAEYLSAKQVTAHVTKQKLEAYGACMSLCCRCRRAQRLMRSFRFELLNISST